MDAWDFSNCKQCNDGMLNLLGCQGIVIKKIIDLNHSFLCAAQILLLHLYKMLAVKLSDKFDITLYTYYLLSGLWNFYLPFKVAFLNTIILKLLNFIVLKHNCFKFVVFIRSSSDNFSSTFSGCRPEHCGFNFRCILQTQAWNISLII